MTELVTRDRNPLSNRLLTFLTANRRLDSGERVITGWKDPEFSLGDIMPHRLISTPVILAGLLSFGVGSGVALLLAYRGVAHEISLPSGLNLDELDLSSLIHSNTELEQKATEPNQPAAETASTNGDATDPKSSTITTPPLDPVQLNPAQTDPAQTDPAQTDLAQTDPAQMDPSAAQQFQNAWQLLAANQAKAALTELEELDKTLPILADHIVMMQAIAYEKAASPTSAQTTWQALLDQHPDSPLIPRALVGLGQSEAILTQFPHHPVAGLILETLLAQQPDNRQVLREIVKHHPQTPDLLPKVNQWVQSQPASLTPEDWQAVADFYWNKWEYGKASRAYDQAPLTPRNLYRNARSHQLSREPGPARTGFQALIQQFPDSEDTPLGRRRYASISDVSTAIALLTPLAEQSLPESADALADLARLYDRNSSPQSAQAARESLWGRFPQSEAAARAAWDQASDLANAGQFQSAITLAQQVGLAQRDTERGSQLVYWSAKWQARLGNQAEAQQSYARVVQQFPHTYYAWRAAVQLGWPVGDFRAGRLPVQVQYEPGLLPLPTEAVSPAVQALHLMGIPEAAWERWQWELGYPAPYGFDIDLPATDIFVMGVLRNAAGDHLKGINQVESIRFDADPAVAQLRQRRDFWEAIYPLHFHNSALNQWGGDPTTQRGIAQWAEQYKLNPLMVASLIRQESRFEADIVSRSGALGLMQVMPSTGSWIASQLGVAQYELTFPADNLWFGSWYLDYTHRTYEDNTMLAIASYNAGPGNVAKWLNRYGFEDPDLFVEQIPFSETQGYVKSVFGNYWNYWQLYTQEGKTLIDREL